MALKFLKAIKKSSGSTEVRKLSFHPSLRQDSETSGNKESGTRRHSSGHEGTVLKQFLHELLFFI